LGAETVAEVVEGEDLGAEVALEAVGVAGVAGRTRVHQNK
jgi:hypothetical protein